MWGDCRDAATQHEIESIVGDVGVDLVLSDMSPNISGIRVADAAAALELATTASDCARAWLKPGGSMIVKVFHGNETDDFIGDLKNSFESLKRRKPHASRSDSKEFYVVAQRFVI